MILYFSHLFIRLLFELCDATNSINIDPLDEIPSSPTVKALSYMIALLRLSQPIQTYTVVAQLRAFVASRCSLNHSQAFTKFFILSQIKVKNTPKVSTSSLIDTTKRQLQIYSIVSARGQERQFFLLIIMEEQTQLLFRLIM